MQCTHSTEDSDHDCVCCAQAGTEASNWMDKVGSGAVELPGIHLRARAGVHAAVLTRVCCSSLALGIPCIAAHDCWQPCPAWRWSVLRETFRGFLSSSNKCCRDTTPCSPFLNAGLLLRIFLYPEDGGDVSLRNVIPEDRTLHNRRRASGKSA